MSLDNPFAQIYFRIVSRKTEQAVCFDRAAAPDNREDLEVDDDHLMHKRMKLD